MASMSVTEARAVLPELLSRVEQGEQITITRHGRDIAVLISPHHALRRRGTASELAQSISAAIAPREPEGAVSATRAEELVAALRAVRDSR